MFAVLSQRMPSAKKSVWRMRWTPDAGRRDMDQEAAVELARGPAHCPHAIPAPDAVVFPPEGDGVGIGTDRAAV